METGKGKMIFFNERSRFGFIKNYYDNKNYYVNERNFLERLVQEDDVEFELIATKRGAEAINVKKSVKSNFHNTG